MKKQLLLILLFISVFISGLFAQDQQITIEDIWRDYKFFPRSVSGFNFLNDGEHYTKVEDRGATINKYNLKSGDKVTTVFEAKMMQEADENAPKKFSSYSFNSDESKLLLATNVEAIYRHSTRANFYIWDLKDKKLNAVSEGGKQRLAAFNATSDKVAFVRQNNLFYKDLATGKEIQITEDGKPNEIINGATDWVNEEEFGLDRAFFWSPDGNKIAFMRYDESKVKEFTMTLYKNGLYPEYETFKYPKAGEDNAITTVHIYDLKTGKTAKVDIGEAYYIPRVKWTQDANQLCVFTMNRHQNDLKLLLAEASTGKTTLLMNETNEWYVDIHDDLKFLKDGKHFIWTSEKSGYNHIYLYDMEGKMVRQITKGDFDVTKLYGVDEEKGLAFYQAAENSPLEREVYSVNLKSKKKKKLTKAKGTSTAKFSKTFDYFIHTYSTIRTPSTYVVRNHKGKKVRSLEDNARFVKRWNEYALGGVEFFSFKNEQQIELNGYMIKPPNFDANKQYPVFMYVYGGPGSQTVKNSWAGSNYSWFQMLAQKGYIVVSVDNRGTGARGEKFKKITYKELGKYETEDQIQAAKYLGGLPYVDASRIGIFGWSYGGYMSSLCLFKGNDVFKAAIAVAPVTNWKWYDTIYTERYMRTPKENKDGYEKNSPINYADRLKGAYLLVHGNADDNVHFQNSVEMANALIKANKQFDTYYYPNRNHGIYGGNTRLHLYTKMTNFILENL